MTRADLLTVALVLAVSAVMGWRAGVWLFEAQPSDAITHPTIQTPITSIPTATPSLHTMIDWSKGEDFDRFVKQSPPFVPIANPEGWCWVCEDSHGCRGALVLSSLCLTLTPEPASYHGF